MRTKLDRALARIRVSFDDNAPDCAVMDIRKFVEALPATAVQELRRLVSFDLDASNRAGEIEDPILVDPDPRFYDPVQLANELKRSYRITREATAEEPERHAATLMSRCASARSEEDRQEVISLLAFDPGEFEGDHNIRQTRECEIVALCKRLALMSIDPPPPETPKPCYTIDDIVKTFSISRATVNRKRKDDRNFPKPVSEKRPMKFDQTDIDEFMAAAAIKK